jgi:hypothetical protein
MIVQLFRKSAVCPALVFDSVAFDPFLYRVAAVGAAQAFD